MCVFIYKIIIHSAQCILCKQTFTLDAINRLTALIFLLTNIIFLQCIYGTHTLQISMN